MSIFIANPSKQTVGYCYRVPESRNPKMVEIPSGQQVEIGKGWNTVQTESVVSHLRLFGAKEASEMSRKVGEFTGLLFSVDKKISENQIVTGHDAVVGTQEIRSVQEATRGALAFDNTTRERKGRGKRTARETSVEVKQDVPARTKKTGNEVDFSFTVAPDGDTKARLPV